MKKVLFQSDDFGLSHGVTDGIIRAIEDGIIRNTGLFVNMDSSEYAVKRIKAIKNVDFSLGIDINLVAGRPVSRSTQVPHLIDDSGLFLNSKKMMQKSPLVALEGILSIFEDDPYPYEEVLVEVENQVQHFIKMMGKTPDYMSPHSLMTPNIERATKEVAEKYHIYRLVDMMNNPRIKPLPGFLALSKNIPAMDQLEIDVEKILLEKALPSLQVNDTAYYIFHCGYVDEDLFRRSSMTLRRIKDLQAATSIRVKQFIENEKIELITYKDIVNMLTEND